MGKILFVAAFFAVSPSFAASKAKVAKPAPKVAAAAAEPAKADPGKDAAPKGEEAAAEAAKEKKPVHVRVACYVLNIGKFDIATGTYTVDFYLDMQSDEDMGEQKFEFMNGRAASMDRLIDTQREKFIRIQANLATNVNLQRYPWDQHSLPVILENGTRKIDDLIYEVDNKQSGIDPSVTFVGWDLKGYQAETVNHVYKVYTDDKGNPETYSQYIFKINIARLMLISSMKTFLPVLVFLLISLVSLLITVEKSDSRLGINTAMLIASVMFHLSIQGQLPPAGYLTVADKVMVATYATIGVNLFLSVHMMRLVQLKQDEPARKWRNASFKVVPGFALLAYMACTLL